jgi:hypothetical protein
MPIANCPAIGLRIEKGNSNQARCVPLVCRCLSLADKGTWASKCHTIQSFFERASLVSQRKNGTSAKKVYGRLFARETMKNKANPSFSFAQNFYFAKRARRFGKKNFEKCV